MKLVLSTLLSLALLAGITGQNTRADDAVTLLCSAASSVVEARRLLHADSSIHRSGAVDPDTPFQSILLVIRDGWSNYPPPDKPEWLEHLKECKTLSCLQKFLKMQVGMFMRCTQSAFGSYEDLQSWLHRQKLYSGHHSLIYIDERLRFIRFDEQNALIFSRFGRRDAAKAVQSLGLNTSSRNLWLGDTQQPGVLAIVPYNGLDQFIRTGKQPPLPAPVHVPLPQPSESSPSSAQTKSPVQAQQPQQPQGTPGLNATVPEDLAPVVSHTLNGMVAGFIGHMLIRPSRSRTFLMQLLLNRSMATHMIAGGILFGATGYMIWNGLKTLDERVPEWGAITMAGWRLSTNTLYSLGNILANQAYTHGERWMRENFTDNVNVFSFTQRDTKSVSAQFARNLPSHAHTRTEY